MAPNLAPPTWFKRATSQLDSAPAGPRPAQEVIDNFKKFVEAESFQECLVFYNDVLKGLGLQPAKYQDFYYKFRMALAKHVPFKYQEIFKILDTKAKQKPYGGWPADKQRVLIVGAGPVGLRAAIETQLLGAKTIVVERRPEFTRHNILKLWKFLLQDFKSLGAKKFVGQFCSGTINHIGIKTLQLFLVKVSLILGIRIEVPMMLIGLDEPADDIGWTGKFNPEGTDMDNYEFDMVIVASGKRVAIEGFNRRSLDAKLSIAVTANFKNNSTREEALVNQISGVSKQYNMEFFDKMNERTNIDLENFIYYRGETHYFVMTALRKSLIEKGVILKDMNDRKALMAPDNINRDKLHEFAIEAAQYATEQLSYKLPVTEFALNARGSPDCAVFDFTDLYSAKNASLVKVRNGQQLLLAIAGDSLLEPFWPEGTGCGRGILSAMDAAWMLRQWSLGRLNPLEILTERENIYKLLSQTSDGGYSNMKENHKAYTIDPTTRYRNIPKKIEHEKIIALYDSDAVDELDYIKEKFVMRQFYEPKKHKTLLKRLKKGMVKKKNLVVQRFSRQRSAMV